jgi:F-type H+-transporting ATPase subunit gamma
MATLRDIQRRIRSVQSTQKITKAMKLVAASKFRRAQERILAARPYATKMRELLVGLGGQAGDEPQPLLTRRETGRKRLVIITADKGLCGAFNSNVLRESLRFLRGAAEASVTLVVVGKKARDFYRRRQFTVKSEMLGIFDRLAYSHAQELAGGLMQDYLAGDVDEVHLMYNEFRSVAVQHPVRQQLLPIEAERGADDAGPQEEYLYEPGPEAILASLLPRHVTVQVYRALMESAAGEYGARMTAMEAASKNAREMIHVLTIQYKKEPGQ